MNKLFVSLLITVLIGACQSYEDVGKARRIQAQENYKNGKDIVVGIVWPRTHSGHFLEGVELAVNEINSCGGVKSSCCQCQQAKNDCERCQKEQTKCEGCQQLKSACESCQHHPSGRKLKTLIYDEDSPQFSPRIRNAPQRFANQLAVEISKNLDVVAVIGHPPSAEAIPASVVYQYYRVLFLAPASTNLALTNPAFPLVFRLIPNNQYMAEQLVGYCALYKHYKNIVVLNVRSIYGEELADSFNESAGRIGLNIVHRGSFFADVESFHASVIAPFKEKQFDAIFIAAGEKEGYRLTQQILQMGISQPIIGGDALYSEKFVDLAGKADVTVPVIFKETSNFAQHFIEQYRKTFKQEPDHWAAQGYDSIQLLAHAIEGTDSSFPYGLATFLRYMPMWIGATGIHAFEEDGEIEGKQFSFKELDRSGKWVTIPGAQIPYLLHKLEQRHHSTTQQE